MPDIPLPRVAVMGAGGVGCYYGGMLARAGVPVTFIGRAGHVDAIRRDGLVIEFADGRREVVRADASTDAAAVRDADVVLLCVKSPDTTGVCGSMLPLLSNAAAVVTLQNGVDNAARAAQVLPGVVLASVVYVGVYMAGPGIVRHTGRGDLVLGVPRESKGRAGAGDACKRSAALFERAGVACPVADDIEAALWTKLVVNCAFNAISAIGRSRYERMAREPAVRDVMEAATRECVAVARADSVMLDEAKMIAAVWNVAGAMGQQYSSTAQDVLRGKPTEIDSLNGYVVRRGEALGVATPVNRTLHALVKLREAGDDLG